MAALPRVCQTMMALHVANSLIVHQVGRGQFGGRRPAWCAGRRIGGSEALCGQRTSRFFRYSSAAACSTSRVAASRAACAAAQAGSLDGTQNPTSPLERLPQPALLLNLAHLYNRPHPLAPSPTSELLHD